MKKRVKQAVSWLLCCLLLVTAGCWSKKEMESQAYILVLGIDVADSGGYMLYAQVGKPMQSEGGKKEQPTFETLVSQGRNIAEAVTKLFFESTKTPDLSHLQLLFIGKELATKGVQPVLDFLRRDLSIRENIRVCIADKSIDELTGIAKKLGEQPAMSIINQFLISRQRSLAVEAELKDFFSQLLEPDLQAVLPVIGVADDSFTLGKTAVFDGYRLAATLDNEQTFGLLLWRNQVNMGFITVPQQDPAQVVSFNIIGCRTKLKTDWRQEKLFVRVDVEVTMDIWETTEVSSSELSRRAQLLFAGRLRDALQVARSTGIDFLGLGAALRRQQSDGWLAVGNDWQAALQNGEFDLRCQVFIRGQGPVR